MDAPSADSVGPPWTVPAAATPGEHELLTVNGLDLHAVTAGPASGPLVVLLHGFPEFWYAWRKQIPALAEAGYRVVAPDMRGYNRSAKPAGVPAYHVEHLVDDAVGLVETLGHESAHLVGHDWGGLVAWHTASRRPEVVDHLAIANAPHPTAFERALRSDPRQLARSWYVGLFQVPGLPEWLLGLDDHRPVERLLAEGPTDPDALSETDIERYRQAFAQPGAATAALNYYRAIGRRAARRLLTGAEDDHRIDAPTLLVWGDRDAALDVSLTEGLGEWVPALRVEHLPTASHWVQQDAPERVSDLLVSHLPPVQAQ